VENPDVELVSTHRIELEPGVVLVFEQTLWGKVIAIRELELEGGRYPVDDYQVTATLRELLEASTIGGKWVGGTAGDRTPVIREAVQDVIGRLYGPPGEW
jgi:hypothetical protein